MTFSSSRFRLLFSFSLLIFSSFAHAGTESPLEERDTLWPLDRSIRLTSNFCESRGRRFHAGIDLSIGGVPGTDLISPVDGYVSRVSASWRGYGVQLLIQGDDGRQYLFAHLLDLRDDLEEALRSEQHRQDDYHVTLLPEPDTFPVQRGHVIARCGESGSGPAHLHFEVRDSLGIALNPMLHGFCPPDHRPPIVRRIALISEAGLGEPPNLIVLETRASADPTHRTLRDTLLVSGRLRLAIEAVDRVDQSSSSLLPLRYMLASKSDTLYHSRLTQFDFSHNRQSSGFFHRGLPAEFKGDFIQLWPQSWDLPFQDDLPFSSCEGGVLDAFDLSPEGEPFLIEVEDAAGNLGCLHFFAKPHLASKGASLGEEAFLTVDSYGGNPDRLDHLDSEGIPSKPVVQTHFAVGIQMEMSDRSFLDDVVVEATVLPTPGFGLGGIHVGPSGLPIADDLRFSFPCVNHDGVDGARRSSLYFIEESDTSWVGGEWIPNSTQLQNASSLSVGKVSGRWEAAISEPGSYVVLSDSVEPSARLKKIIKGSSPRRPVFVWDVVENLSGLSRATLEIADQLFYPRFESDTDQLLFKPFHALPAGPLPWKLYLEDRAGNTAQVEGTY